MRADNADYFAVDGECYGQAAWLENRVALKPADVFSCLAEQRLHTSSAPPIPHISQEQFESLQRVSGDAHRTVTRLPA